MKLCHEAVPDPEGSFWCDGYEPGNLGENCYEIQIFSPQKSDIQIPNMDKNTGHI